HQGQAVAVDLLRAFRGKLALGLGDRADAAVIDQHVGGEGRGAAAVPDAGIAKHDTGHGKPPLSLISYSAPRTRAPATSSSIGLRRMPMPSISTSTVSPCFMKSCGLRAMPTPDGVPLTMISPGLSVIASERMAIRLATSKIMSAVVALCTTWSLSR